MAKKKGRARKSQSGEDGEALQNEPIWKQPDKERDDGERSASDRLDASVSRRGRSAPSSGRDGSLPRSQGPDRGLPRIAAYQGKSLDRRAADVIARRDVRLQVATAKGPSEQPSVGGNKVRRGSVETAVRVGDAAFQDRSQTG